MTQLYIGLMSGTSLDGLDIVVVDLSNHEPKIINQAFVPMPEALRSTLFNACNSATIEYSTLACLDNEIARLSAKAVDSVLSQSNINKENISAIGSHGQTIFHAPEGNHPTTLQIGDPNLIVELTGITTIADFRRRDVAAGGQGAPLVPAFHHAVFSSTQENRVILNIGGIANITILPKETSKEVIGFDTGPGNVLMDFWANEHINSKYDKSGSWASTGQVNTKLLEIMLQDDFFARRPPKSTGRETFNPQWLSRFLSTPQFSSVKTEDIQATLLELTALSISHAIQEYAKHTNRVITCGGGAYNAYLLKRIQASLNISIDSSSDHGIAPDWVEATAFAWLAKQTMEKRPGNLPSVTGAQRAVILGGIYYR